MHPEPEAIAHRNLHDSATRKSTRKGSGIQAYVHEFAVMQSGKEEEWRMEYQLALVEVKTTSGVSKKADRVREHCVTDRREWGIELLQWRKETIDTVLQIQHVGWAEQPFLQE